MTLMTRRYIDDHHIVARYLADQLSDSEREAFEAYYVEHPEIMQELEATAALKVGLMQLRDTGALDRLMKQPQLTKGQRVLAAMAAVTIVGIALATFMLPPPVPAPPLMASPSQLLDKRGAPLPIAATHTLMRTRGSEYDAEIDLPAKPHVIELRVLPEYDSSSGRYRIALSVLDAQGASRDVGTIGNLGLAADGFVPVSMNSARLEPGRYRVTLSTAESPSANDEVSVFTIRLHSSESPAR
jgi:hypothetical protein